MVPSCGAMTAPPVNSEDLEEWDMAADGDTTGWPEGNRQRQHSEIVRDSSLQLALELDNGPRREETGGCVSLWQHSPRKARNERPRPPDARAHPEDLQRTESQAHSQDANARGRVRDDADREVAVRPLVANVRVANDEGWLPNGKNHATDLPSKITCRNPWARAKSAKLLDQSVEQCQEAVLFDDRRPRVV